LLIEEYFVHLERTFVSCPHVIQTTLTKDKRAPHIGFVKGTIMFSQGIELFRMEFVRTQPRLVKTKYRYHCQDANGKLYSATTMLHTIASVPPLTIADSENRLPLQLTPQRAKCLSLDSQPELIAQQEEWV
jgi:hypothetical protein